MRQKPQSPATSLQRTVGGPLSINPRRREGIGDDGNIRESLATRMRGRRLSKLSALLMKLHRRSRNEAELFRRELHAISRPVFQLFRWTFAVRRTETASPSNLGVAGVDFLLRRLCVLWSAEWISRNRFPIVVSIQLGHLDVIWCLRRLDLGRWMLDFEKQSNISKSLVGIGVEGKWATVVNINKM